MSNYTPRRSATPMILFIGGVVVVIVGCVIALLIHSNKTTPTPAPATATAPVPGCATIFRVGAPVTAADATVACTNRLGLVSRQHSMPCHDGRVMIVDRDANVYGFAGGAFGASDTAADSQYARDFSACVG